MPNNEISIVVPNWNGKESLAACLDSLLAQTRKSQVVVVDNGSIDGSVEFIEQKYPNITLIKNSKNLGFAGGVNVGIKKSIEQGAQYVALFNNDAIADKNWLKNLVNFLEIQPKAGVATSKICDIDKTHIDSTGDLYTVWGLPFPRGRGEPLTNEYDNDIWVFSASGGASLYRVAMLQEIGLFDEDFFAYYEDVDVSFRAQLYGWKVAYEPSAIVYHEIGATSSKIKGFTTYQTLKNLPVLMWKNVPWRLMPKVWPRLTLVYWSFALRALLRGQFGPCLKGIFMATALWPKKLVERHKIQKNRKVTIDYINSIITHDLPPNAHSLRSLRNKWWSLRGKKI